MELRWSKYSNRSRVWSHIFKITVGLHTTIKYRFAQIYIIGMILTVQMIQLDSKLL